MRCPRYNAFCTNVTIGTIDAKCVDMVHTSKCTNCYIGTKCVVPIQRKMLQCHKIRKLMLKCLFTNTTKVDFKQNILFETKSIQHFASRRKLSIMGTD